MTQNTELDVAYIQLNSNPIAQSREIGQTLIVDVDKFDQAVGVELLSLSHIPLPEDIEKLAHVNKNDVAQLKMGLQTIQRSSVSSGSPTNRSRVDATTQTPTLDPC
ncbi:DUF2283 domain-containing protein [Corynebacterium aquilae]|uniref:DUF2283 domain-containing protein n=1 Tax=Corynebacterium aquilae TaxID=203263 RepID=UPI0014747322|nr:DUF2283 domain-containing protein [Corynebacterium aquilae]